jgi:hypothetical protein
MTAMAKNTLPTPNQVEQMRERYPRGARVALVSMSDPYTTLIPGDEGTVDFVDDTGTVFVDWDRGSNLGCVYGEDCIRILPVVTDIVREQILAIRETALTNMFDTNAVQRLAYDRGYHELVDFIETDASGYAQFILTGRRDGK